MRGVPFRVLMGLAVCALLTGAGLPGAAPRFDAAPASLRTAGALFQQMLEWAVLARPLPGQPGRIVFPDRQLIKDASPIRVSSENLPPGVRLSLPGRKIEVLPEARLEKMAEEAGKFPAFRFSKVMIIGEFAELGLELRWFLRKPSGAAPLSGGGVRIRFRWQGGEWRFEKRLGMWIS